MNTSTPPSWLAFGLNLVGGAAVVWGLSKGDASSHPAWVLILALLAVAAWVGRGAVARLGRRRIEFVLCLIAALAGGLVAAPTNGLGVVPAAVAVMVVIGGIDRPAFVGFGLALVTTALIAVGAVPFATSVSAALAMMGGVLLAAVAGLSRRQFRQAEEQAVLLRDQQLAMREEKAQLALLGQRQEMARDIHDVLAHSLGGLVIQLDAVDALLESGDASSARQRVTDARRLAADGLGEARRAVAALRDPSPGTRGQWDAGAAEWVAPGALAAGIDDLLAAHRPLGGIIDLTVAGPPAELSRAQASAIQRAVQESLSNARKHAPGEPVRVRVDWQAERVRLTVSNPLADDGHHTLAATGSHHGLEGMRERFAALPLGGVASAGVEGDRFTVIADVVLVGETQ